MNKYLRRALRVIDPALALLQMLLLPLGEEPQVKFDLRPGERILADTLVVREGRTPVGLLALTSQRILFDTKDHVFPFWMKGFETEIADIVRVNKTDWWHSVVFGGVRLEIKLRSGKVHRVIVLGRRGAWDERNPLDKWVRLLTSQLSRGIPQG